MKTQLTLLASCLLGVGLASGQTTTNPSSTTTGTSTYSASPVTDTTSTSNSTYSTTPTTMSSDSASRANMNANGTYSTTPTTNSYNNSATTTTTTDTYTTPARDKKTKDYKNFVFGIYAGLNTTRFKGEDVNGDNLSGRLGYQAGFFVRGGGRLFGQLGGEYFASSSNYFRKGDGQSAQNIQDQINIQYVQIPVYIGYKLVESDRGISAVRLQVGLEYANRINSNSNSFNLSNSEIKSGTFNGLGQLGFDIGPLLIDLTYHYGFSNSIEAVSTTGFAGSQRRILSASVGFKF
ncbi:PorT family protein [Spirosoma aureum]|uniref:PorT family protein n=1 Tax=Spirosoma aureum TaxID=2692134 RepID=A0A6G9AJZ4_9BACT|nr:outer membrane beta-barrel protein [Spirosoma aureum]QIP12791.1 PorT family protein [Spirosoma aureum]